jgi:hypothetical protein
MTNIENGTTPKTTLIKYLGSSPYSDFTKDIRPGAILVFELHDDVFPMRHRFEGLTNGVEVPASLAPEGPRQGDWVAITDVLYKNGAVIKYYEAKKDHLRVEATFPTTATASH